MPINQKEAIEKKKMQNSEDFFYYYVPSRVIYIILMYPNVCNDCPIMDISLNEGANIHEK